MGHVCRNLDGNIAEYDRWFMAHFGMKRRVEILVPDFGMVLRALEGTNRIATAHLRHARMYAKQFSLRLVRPPVEFPPLTELLQWHQHQDRDPGLVWLRSCLRAVAAEI
jgi:DNA-binding transcriptional LysR family regulator